MKTSSPVLLFKEVMFKCFVKWLSSIIFAFALTCHPALPLTATIYECNTLKILLILTKSSELQESKFNTEKSKKQLNIMNLINRCLYDKSTYHSSVEFSHLVLFESVTPWFAACKASLSITISQSSQKLMSIESVMPSRHLILCWPLLLLHQSLPASESFPMSQLFETGGHSIGVSDLASFLQRTPRVDLL